MAWEKLAERYWLHDRLKRAGSMVYEPIKQVTQVHEHSLLEGLIEPRRKILNQGGLKILKEGRGSDCKATFLDA